MFGKAKSLSLWLAAVAGAAVGGAAIAGAATSHNGTATTPATPGQPPPGLRGMPAHGMPPGLRSMPAPGSTAHEDAEKAVTGSVATKAQDAAVKAAGGGTAGEVTTDFFGKGYEVTVTKTDGTKVEYHLDSSFTVMPPPGGAPGGPPGGFGRFGR